MTTSIGLRPTSGRSSTAAVLFLTTAVCWIYLFALRSEMGDMSATADMPGMGTMAGMGDMETARSILAMPMTSAWTGGDIVLMWTMWAVMMAAMMIPSATPMIQAYSKTVESSTRSLAQSTPSGSTSLFVVGYLISWSGFAALGTAAQWVLHDAALVDAMGTSTSRWISGSVLLTAGAYQFSNVKGVCLGKCRTPLGFLLSAWRPGPRGALAMGLQHGTLCIGCCWALMALLFVLGVMNLWWIAIVSTVVLIEKITHSMMLPRVLGVALILWSMLIMTGLVETGVST